jgi:hypothetical protein
MPTAIRAGGSGGGEPRWLAIPARPLLRHAVPTLGYPMPFFPERSRSCGFIQNDEEPLVRGHAAWALGRIGTEAARQALRGREEVEEDAWVVSEIKSSLDEDES